jgi:hypothetical protein
MKTAISVDQRASDGAEAAQPKAQARAGFLENPVRMLM